MNTIYDNTFVLGQTSATNFQAGPGISITQPSEGTVRIGNDETVLWTNPGTNGNTPTKDITWSTQSLSESIANFERVMFIYSTDQSNYAKKCIIFEVKSANDTYALFDIVAGSNCLLRYAAFTLNDTSISNYSNYTRNITFPTNGTVTSTGDTVGYNILYKVIGINRISGSNA